MVHCFPLQHVRKNSMTFTNAFPESSYGSLEGEVVFVRLANFTIKRKFVLIFHAIQSPFSTLVQYIFPLKKKNINIFRAQKHQSTIPDIMHDFMNLGVRSQVPKDQLSVFVKQVQVTQFMHIWAVHLFMHSGILSFFHCSLPQTITGNQSN